MPPKSPRGLFHRLARLRARARRMRSEVVFLLGVVANNSDKTTAHGLKAQLRDARAALADVEEMLEPQVNHIDQPLAAPAAAAP